MPAKDSLNPPVPIQTVGLYGYNRSALINLFKRSKLLYDIYLNGHEHMPREAVLFDCIPILSKADNGVDLIDFPLPPFLLLDELNEQESLNVVGNALLNYNEMKESIEPLKRAVLKRPDTLLSNLKTLPVPNFVYFSGSVSFMFVPLEFGTFMLWDTSS